MAVSRVITQDLAQLAVACAGDDHRWAPCSGKSYLGSQNDRQSLVVHMPGNQNCTNIINLFENSEELAFANSSKHTAISNPIKR